MIACASLPAVSISASGPITRPMVLLDGVIEPRLIVRRVEQVGPLDMRTAVLHLTDSMVTANEWVVAEPVRLNDEQIRWRVLVKGAQPTRLNNEQLILTDTWSDFVGQPIEQILGLDRDGKLATISDGFLSHTRSSQRIEVNGQMVYVLQNNGNTWTVYDALESLNAMAGLSLNLRGIPRRTAEAPLVSPVDLTLPAKRILEQILESYGLVITRELVRVGQTHSESRIVRPLSHGRRVTLRWANTKQPRGDALKVIRQKPEPGAKPWIAQARGPLVESTFELVGGWDPGLEGSANSEYDRSASSDFSLYANAYRHWVLNEDGAYSDDPFNRGNAYDLTSLFSQDEVAPTPLRFLSCVTLDDGGNARKPIVEFSTDSGASWSQWSGRVRLLTDRAAVYLDDSTLPVAFLTAALAGTAKVRVTASLRSPLPVKLTRWQGNPFAGVRPARELDLSKQFLFKRVDAGSIHFTDVQAGTLDSDARDDAIAMHTWLVDRMWRDEQTLATKEGEAKLTLLDATMNLQPGDRLFNAASAGRNSDDQAQALHTRGSFVTKITNDYDTARTTTWLRY